MENSDKNQNLKKLEEALSESLKEDVSMEKGFKRNLDKLVENTIHAEQLKEKENSLKETPKKGFIQMMFAGAKWQVAFLTSFVGILLFGSIAFAAVPELRELIVPTQGKVYINSEPEGASVYFKGGEYSDFTLVGETPLEEKFKRGDYEMKLSLENYEEYLTSFELKESFNLEVNLKRKQTALDKIKEWKTYTDLENGFEFTYPLSWTIEKENGFFVEVSGENSKFSVYEDEGAFEEFGESEEITIKDTVYLGWSDIEDWKYVLIDTVKSQDESRKIVIAYYTKDEEEIDIYEFIKSTVEVSDLKEDQPNGKLSATFNNSLIGFTFNYPSEGWIVVEKKNSNQYAEYEVRSLTHEVEPLKVIYSYGYFDKLNDYGLYENSLNVKRYRSGEDKFLYEFPNRLFVLKELSDDSEINEILEKIVDSFEVTLASKFQDIYDYTWMYSLNAPITWIYSTQINEYEFYGKNYAFLEYEGGSLKIFKWSDIEDQWAEFAAQMKAQNFEYRTSSLKINGDDYTRLELWIDWGANLSLSRVIYIAGDFTGDITEVNPQVSLDGESFVITYVGGLETESLDNVSQECEDTLSVVDAVAASLSKIE